MIWLFSCAFVLVICVGHPVDSRLLSWVLGPWQFIALPCFGSFGYVSNSTVSLDICESRMH